MNTYINLRDLSTHFLDGTGITGTTDDLYNPDNTKVLVSCFRTDIINKIKEADNEVKEIIKDIKEIVQNIKNILQTIKVLKDRLDNDEKNRWTRE
jgi:uncharacterized protein (UPF0335 family)